MDLLWSLDIEFKCTEGCCRQILRRYTDPFLTNNRMNNDRLVMSCRHKFPYVNEISNNEGEIFNLSDPDDIRKILNIPNK